MKRWNIALGFYQNHQTARSVLKQARKEGFSRSASIYQTHDGKFITNARPSLFLFLSVIAFLLIVLFFLNYFFMSLPVSILSTVIASGIAALSWWYFRYAQAIDPEIVSRFQRWVMRDETLVIIQARSTEVTNALTILRSVKSGHPISFLLRSDLPIVRKEEELRSEPIAIEQLQERAEQLATTLQLVKLEEGHDQLLLKRLTKSERLLGFIHHDVSEAEQVEQTITASAEWLLDNMHVIQGTIAEVRRNLPKKYYKELPKIVEGPMADLPRIYVIAQELIDGTAGRLNRENLIAFFNSYQKIDPLTIGELWALPLMLRLRLVECIQFLALQVDRRLREGEAASLWGNRLLNIARREPERLTAFLADLTQEQPNPSPHFAEELLDHLFDDETIIPPVRKWIEECFGMHVNDLIQQEQKRKTAEQVELSNAIVSLITLSQLSWRELFETISPVDAILNEDPVGVYSQMDFSTRDSYRHSIEILSRRSHFSQSELARIIVQMAKKGNDEVTRHVGYYLIDHGRPLLEASIEYKPKLLQRIRRWMLLHPATTYVGGISLLTFIFVAVTFYLALQMGDSSINALLFSLLALLPLSELSVQIVNLTLAQILSPFVLPRMSFEKAIPEENRSLVVMPVMLTGADAIREHVRHLEIYYLANTEPVLRFGLFADFTDAPELHRKSDTALLDIAVTEIEALRRKYGEDKFFLFCRSRSWSESEDAWIGWERKRGKLEWLNRFLIGEELPENILYVGRREALQNIRYVITLDADTQLPKDKARQLIETLTHPLNIPRITSEGVLKRGYTIIQPRVSSRLPQSNVSLFARIFADVTGIDPYSQAVFDIYQDLVHEGSYHGKGIYDLHAFHRVLTGRFPDAHILSHDLIEGAYARVGYASDIVLYDSFPGNYAVWSKRQQRWMRGDWQILDWLFSHVPSKEKKITDNLLSPINRWKIFDNLRRTLFPIACTLLLVLSWLFSPADFLWTMSIVAIFFIPPLAIFLCNFVAHPLPTLRAWDQPLDSILKALINLILLPHQAFLSLDALCRVLYRRYISHRYLLEWGSGSHTEATHNAFIRNLGAASLFAILVFIAVNQIHPDADKVAIAFCGLWIISPFIVYLLDKTVTKTPLEELSGAQRLFIRQIARTTWRFFDEFVGPQTNWLPPDNYQAALGIEIAQRTSPTNIGLAMLSVVTAYDLHYINLDDAVERISLTAETLKKLEQYEGHLLNWYDIRTLTPLHPRYVSTVDSGNLLASLWTLEQSLCQMINAPLLPFTLQEGLQDVLALLKKHQYFNGTPKVIHDLEMQFSKTSPDLFILVSSLHTAHEKIDGLIAEQNEAHHEAGYWLLQLQKQLTAWKAIIERYFSWVDILQSMSRDQLEQLDSRAWQWREEALQTAPSLQMFASGEWNAGLKEFSQFNPQPSLPDALKSWLKNLQEALQRAKWLAGEKMGQVKGLLTNMRELADNTNMAFLYNHERKVFSIGYHVNDVKLDSSYYDLLASEARIASLVSIAKEDAPLDHWWALGRPYAIVYGRQVLRSWGGTMFEYMMPLLFTRSYPDSLLGEACEAAVACQIRYGNSRGIPWGISESAFSAIDIHKTYQYRSFGVPGLGFKRDLEEDLVVSPYSSALASMIDPVAAINNLHALNKDPIDLFSLYGYYESIDFTRQRGPHGERGVIVYAYMAHHQGMALVAFNNVLNNNRMVERFHADPRICGVESLLYERIPVNPPLVKGYRKTIPISRLVPFSTVPIMGVMDTAQSSTPKVNLLSNGDYALMVTNSGGGYSRWNDIDVTRWRADTTSDSWGSYCYLKDRETGKIWSTGFQPTFEKGDQYEVSFKSDKAEYRRRDNQIETLTEVVVSPEDNAEIRIITLANLSKQTRDIELTSYSELALAPHLTDRAHPAFNKMFIETEALPELSGLLAFRRLRSPNDPPIWAGHVVATNQKEPNSPFQYETDRYRFIGRGRSLQFPAALTGDLSNTHGYVLDPIFSLRRRVILEPGQRIQISFVTAIADNRDAVVALLKKYGDIQSSHRAMEMAWAYAQLELRHLRIHQEEAQLFQKLASRILYPHAQLRPPTDRLCRNHLGQNHLWSYGISGDLPIVVATIADTHEIDLIKQVLTAHAFWRLRGLKTDLVILNEETSGYDRPLLEQLQRIILAHLQADVIDQPGGIFLRTSDQIPEEDLTLILSTSRANLVAARGSLRQQLVSPTHSLIHSPRLIPNKQLQDYLSPPLPFIELPFFNGLGGFTPDGREYVIYLGPNATTPAPWINILANPQFGTLVSEAGVGCTWYGNSQTNRLTPWSNDPVLDPLQDALYIRDEELGTFWTPTPGPIRELDAYRIRHGQGYTQFEHNSHGIEQRMTVFVPVDNEGGMPLRIQRLHLRNSSSRTRRLSVTAYSAWVLGGDREETQMHVNTEWDTESQAIFAYNCYNPDFSGNVAFACSNFPVHSYTSDRTEFLGRNNGSDNPDSLKRKSLLGTVGGALDACSALQVQLEIAPGEEKEVLFILGYANGRDAARKLILQTREAGFVDRLQHTTQEWWDQFLGNIQIEVPDLAVNFACNRWLLYQTLSCRIWGRTAFYQSSGAYGFRDQLQDVMALIHTAPNIAREQILRAAAHQFIEGDVQHWWHPPSNGGVRTRITDDLLWLPYVTAHYVRTTKDRAILEESIPFLKGPLLEEEQHETYFVPEVSSESGTLLEHCRRAIQKGVTSGPHGLPLIGGGDWNDGFNRVGIQGKGESVWLAWFLYQVLNDFADLLKEGEQESSGEGFKQQAQRLAEMVETKAWDGNWYRRAYFDDGTPLGSKSSSEASIDSLSQSWAVISGAGDSTRCTTALNSVMEHLVKTQERLILLLTPPFDKSPLDPGYIKGYPPGVRENGAQYTHGSSWVPLAFARKGEGNKAVDLLRMIMPMTHASTSEETIHYKVEPYVLAGDVYALTERVGQGGWSWYTGSAGWVYRIWIEEIFGFKRRGDQLTIRPVIHSTWEHMTLRYRHHSSLYVITIENPDHLESGEVKVELNGSVVTNGEITLMNDGNTHTVRVLLTGRPEKT